VKNVAIFGGSNLGQGPWRPGKKFWSIAIFGGAAIDFHQAQLDEGGTKVVVFSLFGGHKLSVPPEMPISVSGFSILGGRNVKRPHAKGAPAGSATALHIKAISILGGIEITEEPVS